MQLTVPDWIGIAQAIILLLTGFVIAWYTLETARIRKETATQNTLLAEQLRLMQSSVAEETRREMSYIKPYFSFGGGQSSSDEATWDFTNKGGPAKKVEAKPLGKFRVTIGASRILDTNEKGTIVFKAANLVDGEKYLFEITCLDKLDNRYVFRFQYQHRSGVTETENI